jgi:quinol monooxygenase YgiN
MIMAVMELVPSIEKRQAMLDILRFVVERVRRNRECLDCGVFEAADHREKVLYVEQWRCAKDLNTHIQSALYLSVLNAMELASEKPKISFYKVSETQSLELIEQLRS